MEEKQMYNFFRWMFFLPLLPYISFLLPFLPQQIGPFNISGIAWLMMYGVVIYYMFAGKSESKFPYFLTSTGFHGYVFSFSICCTNLRLKGCN